MKRAEDESLVSAISPPPEFSDFTPCPASSVSSGTSTSTSSSSSTLEVVVPLPPPKDFRDLTPSPGIGDPLLISFGFSPHSLPPYQSFHHGRGFVRKYVWDFADRVSFNILNEAMVIATVVPEAGGSSSPIKSAATARNSSKNIPEPEENEVSLPGPVYNQIEMTEKCETNVHSISINQFKPESQTTITSPSSTVPFESDIYSLPKDNIGITNESTTTGTSTSKKHCSRSINNKCTGLGVAEALSAKWKCRNKTSKSSKHYKLQLANRHSIHLGENLSGLADAEESKNSCSGRNSCLRTTSLSLCDSADSVLLGDKESSIKCTKSTKSKSQELCTSSSKASVEQNNNKLAESPNSIVGKFPVKKRSKIVGDCFHIHHHHHNQQSQESGTGILPAPGSSSHFADFEASNQSTESNGSTGNLGKVFKNLFRRNRSKDSHLRNSREEETASKVTDIPTPRDKQTDSESFDHARARPLPPTPPPPEPPISLLSYTHNDAEINEETHFDEPIPVPTNSHVTESADFSLSLEKVKDVGHWRCVVCECGWYWGPLSSEVAEDLLRGEPDGSFIVRDSSDARYIFSLTFKLNGLIRHVRIEHDQGNFSFGPLTRFKAATIVDFIENAVSHSRSGRYLFFLHRRPILGPMRVQLLYPYSRFRHPRSLQHMCRFVILKCVRRDLLNSLNLPKPILDYLNTTQYYFETQK